MYLSHYILSVLERLGEIADGAYYIFVAVNGEREDGNEAECEPGIALDHSRGPVPLRAVSDEGAFDVGCSIRSYGIDITHFRNPSTARRTLHSVVS
jgi:hypothetical protein